MVFIKTCPKTQLWNNAYPYWLVQCYQCYRSIKTAYACIRNQVTEFWNYKIFVWLTASLSQDLVALGVWLQNVYTTKVITSYLWNYCSNEHLSTAPWCFLLSFITHVVFVFISLTKRWETCKLVLISLIVGKMLINLLRHAKSATCIISIIIDAPAVVYVHS